VYLTVCPDTSMAFNVKIHTAKHYVRSSKYSKINTCFFLVISLRTLLFMWPRLLLLLGPRQLLYIAGFFARGLHTCTAVVFTFLHQLGFVAFLLPNFSLH